MTSFDDLCVAYSTWIIKYSSAKFKQPIFLIWYTTSGQNSIDKLLTFSTGEIFGSENLPNIKNILLNNLSKLNKEENLDMWLTNFNNFIPTENTTYNIDAINDSISGNLLDTKTIEGLANFTNLFGDYVNQDSGNSTLQKFLDNEFINETWEYFYQMIFWPRFNDREKFETWNRPQLDIDNQMLLKGFIQMKEAFENNIRLAK